MKFFILTVLLLVSAGLCKSPPVFNYSYQISFDVGVIRNQQEYHTMGQEFYDPLNNRERVDLANGIHNEFCGTVLPNVNTSCQALTVQGNRWIIFPSRSQCCFCCTSKHGCGILAPDWLKHADYQGVTVIDGDNFDKWHETGTLNQNFMYVTVEDEIPRRLVEGKGQTTNYNLKDFKKTVFPDSVFAIPSYCNADKPANCPLTSLCGILRQDKNLVRE